MFFEWFNSKYKNKDFYYFKFYDFFLLFLPQQKFCLIETFELLRPKFFYFQKI